MVLRSCTEDLAVGRQGAGVGEGMAWPARALLVMPPQKNGHRLLFDMDLNAKSLLPTSFQIPWSKRSGFSCFFFVVVVVVF